MIATISVFTLLLLQITQFLIWIFIIYLAFVIIRFPVRYFWNSITHKTKYE
jgi:hypothetical protein